MEPAEPNGSLETAERPLLDWVFEEKVTGGYDPVSAVEGGRARRKRNRAGCDERGSDEGHGSSHTFERGRIPSADAVEQEHAGCDSTQRKRSTWMEPGVAEAFHPDGIGQETSQAFRTEADGQTGIAAGGRVGHAMRTPLCEEHDGERVSEDVMASVKVLLESTLDGEDHRVRIGDFDGTRWPSRCRARDERGGDTVYLKQGFTRQTQWGCRVIRWKVNGEEAVWRHKELA